MDLVPKSVSITVPVNRPELRGRHATTPPHGVVLTIRTPVSTMAEVDMAISHIDPTMSRGLFIRLVIASAARSINTAYDNVRRQAEEITHGYEHNDATGTTD